MGSDNITSTTPQPDESGGVSRNLRIVSLFVYSVVLVFGILGNGAVIYVTGCRMKRTVNSVWFLNLALADFLFTAFLIFAIMSVSQEHQWQFGEFMCKLNGFVAVVNMFASIFLLTVISLDRCLSTWVVVWAQNKRTVCKAQVTCVVVWMTAVVCSIPYAHFRGLVVIEGNMYCGYSGNITHEQKYFFDIFRFVVGFLIPFFVILVSYVAIGVRVSRLQRNGRNRSRRIIFSIVVAFFLCWLPFHIFSLIQLYTTNQNVRNTARIVGPLLVALAYLNSCLNPILYVFMCEEFQKKLKSSICLVLESALAEDHLSIMSPRSLSSQFSRITLRSNSTAPTETKGTATSLNFEESKMVITVERDDETE
ncbi:C3a anaphylatoxin chemotactic receptor-like isoform X2 [Pungitius pungitius]|uniref:C3a anaphylatoxin chemotactic receptor-like isoform X2 n=1 Tax=Pungitius pungitius TaxID=134920 RepID=UPI001886CCFB|nr:C3a anaphylatoxin chemotactic receptor-like isoform X2 [Pungitius pungitius]